MVLENHFSIPHFEEAVDTFLWNSADKMTNFRPFENQVQQAQ
jgi:hypothetical protein